MNLRPSPWCACVVLCLASLNAAAAGLAGKWTTQFESQIGVQKYVFEFESAGGQYTGKAAFERSIGNGEVPLDAIKVDGDNVSFVESLTYQGTTIAITYSGKIAGDDLPLKREVGDFATEQIVAHRIGGAATAAAVPANPAEQAQRAAAAAMLALGRLPDPAEAAQAGSVAELIGRYRATLAREPAAKRTVAAKAFEDAFGRAPTADELAADSTGDKTYTDLVREHVQWLAGHADEYAKVLNRVYQLVIRRDVYPEEIDYWKKKDAQSFAVLAGCVDNWGRRNQPGLMVTAGPAAVSINCVFLTTVRLSPAVAAEARAAAGLPAVDPSAGTNLLAAGAEKIVTDGRMHFAAVLKE